MIKIGLLLLIAPCLLLMGLYMSDLSRIEDCLLAGGSYDSVLQLCDMQNSHPVQPFMAGNTRLVNSSMLLAMLGFFLCIIGLYRPKKGH
ncbi:MAG: hypothetical protein OFPI_37940 [Osedax symbiont Rs2]|nr:MAG: hypothetical protein OFPI_37940 [Osedax symbiont Rs2]